MLRYTLYEIRRSVLSPSSVFYTIILPVGLYMLFGALQDYAKVKVADGNASAYVMIGMALYGAISSTVSVSGLTVVENVAGWGRQLALTPMNTGKYLFSKCCVAFVMAAVPVIAVNIAARLTGIDMPLNQQIACAALSILCAMVFGFFGLAIGLLVPSESAVGIATAFWWCSHSSARSLPRSPKTLCPTPGSLRCTVPPKSPAIPSLKGSRLSTAAAPTGT